MTTALEWRTRCIALRDAASRREREAKIALDEAEVFREAAEACRIEADHLEAQPPARGTTRC